MPAVQTDPSIPPRRTTLDYTSVPGATKVTDPSGKVRLDEYTSGLRTAVTKGYGTPQAVTWRYAYDPATLGTATIVDPNMNRTTMPTTPPATGAPRRMRSSVRPSTPGMRPTT